MAYHLVLLVLSSLGLPMREPAQENSVASKSLLEIGLKRINDLRKKLGLEPSQLDERLTMAAEAHARCMQANLDTYFNGFSWHEERQNFTGFCGEIPLDRVRHFGYEGGCWECIEGTPFFVRSGPPQFAKPFPPGPMVNAVYHRLPFITPGKLRVGIGRGAMSTVYDMDIAQSKGIVFYPYSGQTGVSTSIWGGESPDPYRIYREHPKSFGCPISLQVKGYGTVQFQYASLSSEVEGELPILINSSVNDNALQAGDFLILPKRKYRPLTRYLAKVEFVDQRGVQHSVSTSFTTSK